MKIFQQANETAFRVCCKWIHRLLPIEKLFDNLLKKNLFHSYILRINAALDQTPQEAKLPINASLE